MKDKTDLVFTASVLRSNFKSYLISSKGIYASTAFPDYSKLTC